jgi:hypothetical protein
MALFKRKSEADRLRKRYEKLMKEAFQVSKIDRKRSDQIYAEADALMEKISGLESEAM